ncbi:MAG: hypothetical protein FJ313_06335 [Gemmatimonadetes bacterium]|nr:hypothetical protein [Gemmatimonadota bacterium]
MALGIVGLLPLLAFVPGAFHTPRPGQYVMLFLPAAAGAVSAMAAAGALMALAARAASGLLWKLPLIAAATAFLVPATDALATALTISPRVASLGLSATSLAVDWLAFGPTSIAAAVAAAIGLRAARRKAGAAGSPPRGLGANVRRPPRP